MAPGQFPNGFVLELYQKVHARLPEPPRGRFLVAFYDNCDDIGRPGAEAAPGQFPIGFVLDLYQKLAARAPEPPRPGSLCVLAFHVQSTSVNTQSTLSQHPVNIQSTSKQHY